MRKTLLPLLVLSFVLVSCKDSTSNSEPDLPAGLIWSNEFNGDDWNREEWYPEFGANGWGNQELQNYTASDDNIEVSDGTLKIIARKVDEGQDVGDYTSARLLSIRSFTYGRIEVRAKMPDYVGNGLWPAIWMLGDGIRNGESWPFCGEIDIMEYVSRNPNKYFATVHTEARNHQNGNQEGSGDITVENIEEEFNIYGLYWEEDRLIFYLNDPGNVVLTINRPENPTESNWPFSKPHFFLLNMAIGGTFGGFDVNDDNFPATFEIDYVRVYEIE
jgi:beta-glucanase (GH16 family)